MSFDCATRVDSVVTTHHVDHLDEPPELWTTDDLRDALDYLCALLRPHDETCDCRVSFLRVADDGFINVLVTVDRDDAITEPLALTPALIDAALACWQGTPTPLQSTTTH